MEGRKGKPYFKEIQKGDHIQFICDQRSFFRTVLRVEVYQSLLDYLKGVGLSQALPGVDSIEKGMQIYRQWSTDEEIKEFGFLAVWLKSL